jgi:anaerobic ribonucleoside-triphosphate reductase activating protein
MRYNKIRKMDISNGPGVRISIFMQGCSFHCPFCFNKETWDFDGGEEFTEDTIKEVLDLCEPEYIKGLSILGGEPMNPTNIGGTTELAKAFKERYGNTDKTLWVWSGYKYEEYLSKQVDTLKYIDTIVDGQFENDNYDPRLEFRGSSNQRIIDVPNSLKENKLVLRDLSCLK